MSTTHPRNTPQDLRSTDESIYPARISDMQVGQLVGIVKHLRLGLIGAIITIVVAYTGFVFELGVRAQTSSVAIPTNHEFEMYLGEMPENILAGIKRSLSQDSVINLPGLKLAESPQFSPGNEEKIGYNIHMTVTEPTYYVYQVGMIATRKSDPPSILSSIRDFVAHFSILPSTAFAADDRFDWHGHKHDTDYTEKYLDKHTVRRYYSDGWVLEYKFDKTGVSIPSSFRWIQKN